MRLGKRIFLFLALNLVIMFTISLILQIFNVQPYLTRNGLDLGALMVFCLIWGMGGAFISLALSRKMAKWMMGVRVIDPQHADVQGSELVKMVHSLARKAGLRDMPEVGIYPSHEVNAFATGPSRSRSLVAVSQGLLHKMNHDELEGVIAHEIAHIANGDMVTMTLIQGVVNAFVMFLARAIAFAITRMGRDGERSSGSHFTYFITVMVLQTIFMILGSIIVAWFSRWREFHADAGGAAYAGRAKMIAALESLRGSPQLAEEHEDQQKAAFNALKISDRPSKFLSLFSTHPPLEVRIARLKGE